VRTNKRNYFLFVFRALASETIPTICCKSVTLCCLVQHLHMAKRPCTIIHIVVIASGGVDLSCCKSGGSCCNSLWCRGCVMSVFQPFCCRFKCKGSLLSFHTRLAFPFGLFLHVSGGSFSNCFSQLWFWKLKVFGNNIKLLVTHERAGCSCICR